MKSNYSWLEIANMPLCCICCGSRNIDTKKIFVYLVDQTKDFGQMKEQTKNMRRNKMKIEKTKQRIKNIIKEIDPRNYPVSIREEKWEYYWTDDVSLASEMFNLVESLMTNEEHKEFSIWC